MSLMEMVAELLEDSHEIRPNSPSTRPAEKLVNKDFSPHSPHSPQEDVKIERKAPTNLTLFKWYSCEVCGSTIYRIAEAWTMAVLPEASPWRYSHKASIGWQCEGCGEIFTLVGDGSRPQQIN